MTGFDWAIIAALSCAKTGFFVGVLAARWGTGERAEVAVSRHT